MSNRTDFRISFEGMDELQRAIKEIPEIMLDEIKNAADNSAATVVLPKVRQKLLMHNKYSQEGDLASRLITKKGKKSLKSMKYKAAMTWKNKSGSTGGGYAAPLELGHKLVVHGKTIGVVPAHPFMRPGADESAAEVNIALNMAIDKALAKMGGLK